MMIKNIFVYKKVHRGIFAIAGILVFCHASVVYGACATFGMDYHFANNYPGGFYNAKNYPNPYVFAALKADGSILAWGHDSYGGSGEPTDSGYTAIYSGNEAFAALKSDGSITAWGSDSHGGSGEPMDSGYTKIYSASETFAALKSDGSITAWGTPLYNFNLTSAPTDSGYTEIFTAREAFAALKADGSITAWGYNPHGGSGAPTDSGYTKIYSAVAAFAALKADGSITAWGNGSYGGSGAPTGSGYTDIETSGHAFAALKSDGSITAWGYAAEGGSGAPTGSGYVEIYSSTAAFAALKTDGSITAWGNSSYGGSGAPTDSGYAEINSNRYAFAALKTDGSITAWGNSSYGGSGAPTDSGYVKIFSTSGAFAALKADGSIAAWGSASGGGSGAPTDDGYTTIYSTSGAFAAIKSNSAISIWGASGYGGSGMPIDFCTALGDITIPNPDPTQMNARVEEGYITINNGTITSSSQITHNVNVTYQTINVEALFPVDTVVTGDGNFNFENFTLQEQDVSIEQPTSIRAFRLGILNEEILFSEDVTVSAYVGMSYAEQELTILYQNEGESLWNMHGSCTVDASGYCIFSTDHATTYTINGEITENTNTSLSATIGENLTLSCGADIDLDQGVMLIPGTPINHATTCSVVTNDQSGYDLQIANDRGSDNTFYHQTVFADPHGQIPDKTRWDATVPNAQVWTGTGFGFGILSSTATKNETWWGTGVTCDDVNQFYAGIPATSTDIMRHTSYTNGQTDTVICYQINVVSTQISGEYIGSVTYTATGRP